MIFLRDLKKISQQWLEISSKDLQGFYQDLKGLCKDIREDLQGSYKDLEDFGNDM